MLNEETFYFLVGLIFITMNLVKRKGARTIADIPKEVLAQLNKGEMETANLVEWLAVDRKNLLKSLLMQNSRKDYLNPIIKTINSLEKKTITTIEAEIGKTLYNLSTKNNDTAFLKIISTHTSDLVRCWATYTVGHNAQLSLQQIFQQIKPFAADNHFGVRESAWFATRPLIIQHTQKSISILAPFATSQDENIRRFSSEATRPRGVWCAHIETLKQNPSLGLSILEPLKSDSSKYVQNSVGNWLNDASKSQPKWVKDLCNRWNAESQTKETAYITKRAMRTLSK